MSLSTFLGPWKGSPGIPSSQFQRGWYPKIPPPPKKFFFPISRLLSKIPINRCTKLIKQICNFFYIDSLMRVNTRLVPRLGIEWPPKLDMSNGVRYQDPNLFTWDPKIPNIPPRALFSSFISWLNLVEYNSVMQCNLRLLDTYASKIAIICHLKTFWPLIQLINHLIAELQAWTSRSCKFLLFLKHRCLVILT